MKRFLPLSIFLLLAWSLAFALLQPKAKPESKLVAMPALTLPALAGKQTVTLNAIKGNVTLINFFASWCTPCAAEMPEFAALKKKYPHLKLHGIVWNDTADTLTPWLKKHGNPFDALWLDTGGKAAVALGIRGIPETYILDRSGTVRYHLAGAVDPMTRDKIHEVLTQLEAEHAAP